MFCTNCGKPIDDGAKFCPSCGAAVEAADGGVLVYDDPGIETEIYEPEEPEAYEEPEVYEEPEEEPEEAPEPAPKKRKKKAVTAEPVTPNIFLGSDGVYRWTYVVNLFKNPMYFLLVLKIMLGVWTGIWLFTVIIDMINWGFDGITDQLKIYLYFVIGIVVFCGLGYLIYAAIMGGKYIVDFEMNDKQLVHIQSVAKKQRKKAEAISTATVIAGALAGKPSMVGLGLTTSGRNTSTSEFSRLKKVIVYTRKGMFKLNGGGFNQAYAEPEDFEFVRNYLRQHIPDSVKWIEK